MWSQPPSECPRCGNRSDVWPIRMSSPGRSRRSVPTRCPFTEVPFLELRSLTYQSSPRRSKTACHRDASSSTSTTSLPTARPTVTRSPTNGTILVPSGERTSAKVVGVAPGPSPARRPRRCCGRCSPGLYRPQLLGALPAACRAVAPPAGSPTRSCRRCSPGRESRRPEVHRPPPLAVSVSAPPCDEP